MGYLATLCSPQHISGKNDAVFQSLVAYLRTLTRPQFEAFFRQYPGPSTFNMALQLVCAQKHQHNLNPALDCVHFVTNVAVEGNSLVDGNDSELFSQANLPYVLPLLEALIGVPVTSLNLSFNKITFLPDSICNLVSLR